MPTYVYACQACGRVIERRQSFSDDPLTVCEACAGELRRVLQPVGIIFKGSGFYSTDYKSGSASSLANPGTISNGSTSESSSREPTPPTPASATASAATESSSSPAGSTSANSGNRSA